MSKITGRVFVKLNGALQRSKPGAVLDPGGFARTAVIGHEVYGYSEEPRQSRVEFTLAHSRETDILALRDLTDALVEFETDTGRKYVIGGAWVAEPPRLTGGQGDVTVVLEGPPAIES